MELVGIWIGVGLAAVAVVLLAILLKRVSDFSKDTGVKEALSQEFRLDRDEASKAARALREEVGQALKSSTETMVTSAGEVAKRQAELLGQIEQRIKGLTDSNEKRLADLRQAVDQQLVRLQESNEKKLEQMRQTVDEKLHTTLEKRLGESFKLVSEHLKAVQQGLGEMRNLATGVGDLKRVLTNVKARGTWGEVQLGALLEQILTPDQYERNVQTKADSRETVEYAIRLPGPDDSPEKCVWLPIDSKFPQEDYLRLVEAAEVSDAEAVQRAAAALVRALQSSARDIHDKYLDPPGTTDFAIMFLPTEGLYAEFLRQPGQVERLQQDHRVVVAGPTTLAAILNSLRMGFRTLAIEKRSSEVWEILGAVKTEFGKFGAVLEKVKRQLGTASKTIDETGRRTRAMQRKLLEVEQLPADSSVEILGLPDLESDDEPGDAEEEMED